ncbi:hypothetical protein BDV96DRAFT_170245 [Lophiotrema nucula]|uniref:Uncharacterized protein n=1 Tax=Lophiotrema nucula TaxID=690887 RepID=A0A6A5YY53_9PLEO|nr:hypothetical protein BDV96DRAFT_170245 [Lophiotrema nucula]
MSPCLSMVSQKTWAGVAPLATPRRHENQNQTTSVSLRIASTRIQVLPGFAGSNLLPIGEQQIPDEEIIRGTVDSLASPSCPSQHALRFIINLDTSAYGHSGRSCLFSVACICPRIPFILAPIAMDRLVFSLQRLRPSLPVHMIPCRRTLAHGSDYSCQLSSSSARQELSGDADGHVTLRLLLTPCSIAAGTDSHQRQSLIAVRRVK